MKETKCPVLRKLKKIEGNLRTHEPRFYERTQPIIQQIIDSSPNIESLKVNFNPRLTKAYHKKVKGISIFAIFGRTCLKRACSSCLDRSVGEVRDTLESLELIGFDCYFPIPPLPNLSRLNLMRSYMPSEELLTLSEKFPKLLEFGTDCYNSYYIQHFNTEKHGHGRIKKLKLFSNLITTMCPRGVTNFKYFEIFSAFKNLETVDFFCRAARYDRHDLTKSEKLSDFVAHLNFNRVIINVWLCENFIEICNNLKDIDLEKDVNSRPPELLVFKATRLTTPFTFFLQPYSLFPSHAYSLHLHERVDLDFTNNFNDEEKVNVFVAGIKKMAQRWKRIEIKYFQVRA